MRLATDQKVWGSNPYGRTIFFARFRAKKECTTMGFEAAEAAGRASV